MSKKVLLSGASGLVGTEVLNLLLNAKDIAIVYCLVRKPLNLKHEKLEQIIFDYNDNQAYAQLPQVDTAFCCLGTTIKKAGSRKAFRKVDFEYPLQIAKASVNNKASTFHVITAMGADEQSNIFYNKVKGELEDALKKLKFEQLYIYRPSLLLGDRKEQRFGEKMAAVFMTSLEFLMQGSLKKYRGIKVEDVAKAMVDTESKETSKLKIFLSDEIQALADNYTNS